tara:strand:+ start:7980 stop:8345 length:366 start_codon:yes stop_codon:yes gene_type:complete
VAINVVNTSSSNLNQWRRDLANKFNQLVTWNNGVRSATAVTTNYTLKTNDTFLAIDGGVIAITLAGVKDPGRRVTVKDTGGNAGTTTITIMGTVDGASNPTITTNYGVVNLISNGTSWFTY